MKTFAPLLVPIVLAITASAMAILKIPHWGWMLGASILTYGMNSGKKE